MADVSTAADTVRRALAGLEPRVAIVLGSGLGALAGAVTSPLRIPYGEIPGFPQTTVHGHAGELIAGMLEGVPTILQSGRFHLYEGHAPDAVALPVRVFADLGIETLIVTNAAGGLRSTFRPPLLMLIADHLNLMWRNPLLGRVQSGEERFPDMSTPYDQGLRDLARKVALENGIALEEGVYAAVLGPSYETPAEIRMLQRLGADAVGMSTVPEVLVARARGLRVLGVSSITNPGAGMTSDRLSHEGVLQAGRHLAGDLERLVRGVVGGLAAA
ncbi:MAG: purine-nucleoside phosphorylase [Gemmatimonadota bacterium]|nr:purine-nucleoside phosphorylase [Gemmatimonadota bacterium]MDH3477439.1 purine-nucleoside phosphorylase [Gemmatimonadota bacterium]MDH5549077.1 purine-nucleoside phosphorylase [Gemmatimonadota bacterium]